MADLRVRSTSSDQTKIRNVAIAVTPEGFWCCPSPAAVQKTLKSQIHQSKHMPSSPVQQPQASQKFCAQKVQTQQADKKQTSNSSRPKVICDDQKCASVVADRAAKPIVEAPQQKIYFGFGQPETSDLKLLLSGKEGIAVRMSVHRDVLAEHSRYFEQKFSRESQSSVINIGVREDVEIYVETIGLMYCKEMKQSLVKQNVNHVLRILKVAELLGFHACIKSCLEYLEAVPWVGDEEEKVVSSIRRLQSHNSGVSPILKRVSSEIFNPPKDTLAQIMDLVLKSNDEKGRREMKSLVLKLLRENSHLISGSAGMCVETLYGLCQSCLGSLLLLFRQVVEPDFSWKSLESRDAVAQRIFRDADNLLWLVDIMADRHVGDEFAVMWAGQSELARLHPRMPAHLSRHFVSCVTARLFVGIGRGELLPSKDTRQMLLQVWLQPLIDDYRWLQHGCRSFDRKMVEEGIGRTILTLPLEDQRSILLSWLGSFLKLGDGCPNLQRAFEVWWRRTFTRSHVEGQANLL